MNAANFGRLMNILFLRASSMEVSNIRRIPAKMIPRISTCWSPLPASSLSNTSINCPSWSANWGENMYQHDNMNSEWNNSIQNSSYHFYANNKFTQIHQNKPLDIFLFTHFSVSCIVLYGAIKIYATCT